MNGKMHLALIETAGNQAYVFETNRLREALGASDLIVSVIEHARSEAKDLGGQVVIGTSGKLEVRFSGAGGSERARDLVSRTTKWALREAPGLDVAGVVVSADEGLSCAVRQGYQKLARVRSLRSGPSSRFRTLPWLRSCDHSGTPSIDERSDLDASFSPTVISKRRWAEHGRKRFVEELALGDPACPRLPWNIEDIAEEAGWNWLGIVHADANGLGRVFLNFDQLAAHAHQDWTYERDLVAFSSALREATREAFRLALQRVVDAALRKSETSRRKLEWVPVLPLILGGDDVTAICDGRYALLLAKSYLEELESLTSKPGKITEILAAARRTGLAPRDDHAGIRACAGVAIVKHHFPFSVAARLAHGLCDSGKKMARSVSCSAIDWHAVLDASPPELEGARKRLEVHGKGGLVRRLTRRPYAVGAPASSAATPEALPRFDDLIDAARILEDRDEEGRRKLPSSQLHDLREALFDPGERASTYLRRIRGRYQDVGLDDMLRKLGGRPDPSDGGKPSLWDGASDGPRSGFIDALDHLEFLQPLVELKEGEGTS